MMYWEHLILGDGWGVELLGEGIHPYITPDVYVYVCIYIYIYCTHAYTLLFISSSCGFPGVLK